jgi:hypothetical protein
MSKGKSMHRTWAVTYDTPIEDAVMVAVSDRCIRRWKRGIKDGRKVGLVNDVAAQMEVSTVVAEHIIDRFISQRAEHMRRKT